MGTALTLEQLINFLLGAPMFGDLDESELSQIVHIMRVQFLREGQAVFREGAPGDAWYVVYEGEVEVFTGGEVTPERQLATLSAPACFGEMAILDGSPRLATVRATSRATILKFTRDDFSRLLDEGNLAAYKLVYHMARTLVARQRSVTARLTELMATAQDPGVHHGLAPTVEEASLSE